MPDDIETSQKISLWLKEQGIIIKRGESGYAPWMWGDESGRDISIHPASYEVHRLKDFGPFFGPGGEGNSLKALFAMGFYVWVYKGAKGRPCVQIERGEEAPYAQCADTGGIALCALLVKLMEEKK